MNGMPRKRWLRGLGLGLAWCIVAALLIWALRDIRFGSILDTLQRLNAFQIVALVAINIGIFLLVTWRWWLILRSQGHPVSLLALFGNRLASFGISYFTLGPQIGGEPAQIYWLQRRHHIPADEALASVSLDKILELLANLLFLWIGVAVALHQGYLHQLNQLQTLLAGTLIFTPLLVYSYSLWSGHTPIAAVARHIRLSRPALRKILSAIISAEEQISHLCREKPWVVIRASALSLLVWLGMVAEYALAAYFLGTSLNIVQTLGAVTASRLAFLFPLPGGLGILEASQMIAAQAMGLNPAFGLSMSLWMRLRDITLGGSGLIWGGLNFRKNKVMLSPVNAGEEP